jgi:Fur family transcriptional regulator, stress-responsive regulator
MFHPVRTPTELTALFRSKGMKVTPQRELVFRLLHENTSHPTADSVYGAAVEVMPMMSLKTVYQVLNDLKALGELQTIEVGTGAARFDPNTGDHHHLVCNGCGVVHDIEINASDLALARGQRHGFSVSDVEITFRGLCPACRAQH